MLMKYVWQVLNKPIGGNGELRILSNGPVIQPFDGYPLIIFSLVMAKVTVDEPKLKKSRSKKIDYVQILLP